MFRNERLSTEMLFGEGSPEWVHDRLVTSEKMGPYERWAKKTHEAFAAEIRRVADNRGFVRGIGVGRLPGEGSVYAVFELSSLANNTPFVGSPDIVIFFHPGAPLERVRQEVRRLIDLALSGALAKERSLLLSQTRRAYDLYLRGN
jgi:hypothetical protein